LYIYKSTFVVALIGAASFFLRGIKSGGEKDIAESRFPAPKNFNILNAAQKALFLILVKIYKYEKTIIFASFKHYPINFFCSEF